jgi:hypothetical protein
MYQHRAVVKVSREGVVPPKELKPRVGKEYAYKNRRRHVPADVRLWPGE